jgi:nitrilase
VADAATARVRAAAHSFEAKAFGIVCAGYMDRRMRDFLVERDTAVAEIVDRTPRAVSMFVDPTGAALGDTLQNEEGIAYAEFDLSRCVEPKQFHDVVGYYNRFDVFDLRVKRERSVPIRWDDEPDPAAPLAPAPLSLQEAP